MTVTEAQTNPIQTIIDEFKTLSPETTMVLIFKNNGQTIANTQATTEDQTKNFILSFCSIAHQAQTIGGIESLTIQAANSQLCITNIDSLFLATVSSHAVNQKILKSLTQVVVPTVVKLIDQTASLPPENPFPQPVQLEKPQLEETSFHLEDEPTVEPIAEPQLLCEPVLPTTPVSQFMVEKIGGILNPSDLVRIDREIITKWIELYNGELIQMVNIETLDGKKTTCEFRAIRDPKSNAKGIIQIPEKILRTMQAENGQLVLVKPVIA